MKPLYKGLLIAVVHLLLVSSLGAKLLYDRATRPRVWVRTTNYDPDMPLRGRYVALQLQVEARGFGQADKWRDEWTALSVENGRLVAEPSKTGTGVKIWVNSQQVAWAGAPSKIGVVDFRQIPWTYRDHLEIEYGIVLHSIDVIGVAAAAGLRQGDVILRVDGNPVNTNLDFKEAIHIATPADTDRDISLTVMRGHDTFTVTVPWRPAPGLEDATSEQVSVLVPGTPFFIPEHIKDPSIRAAGEELWVEVTIPKQGPPRPIRLGVRKDGGDIVPLDIN